MTVLTASVRASPSADRRPRHLRACRRTNAARRLRLLPRRCRPGARRRCAASPTRHCRRRCARAALPATSCAGRRLPTAGSTTASTSTDAGPTARASKTAGDEPCGAWAPQPCAVRTPETRATALRVLRAQRDRSGPRTARRWSSPPWVPASSSMADPDHRAARALMAAAVASIGPITRGACVALAGATPDATPTRRSPRR